MSHWVGRAGVFSVGPAASVAALVGEARAAGAATYVLDPVGGKADFLAGLASLLTFPGWVGRNWDAAADALADLSWLPPGPVVLVWVDPDRWGEADAVGQRTAEEILGEATRRQRRQLTILMVHEHERLWPVPPSG